MTRIIVLPDDGQEWVAVPKVATDEMLQKAAILYGDWLVEMKARYEELLAASPPCKVVELPAAPAHLEHSEVKAWYACLDEIERRAK